MSDTRRSKEFAIQHGNDLYTLDVFKQADDALLGLVSVFKDFRPNAGLFTGEPLKELRGMSASQMESEFKRLVGQVAI